jgi:Cwf15/Cwc15 cell cycle control protein
MRERDLSAMSKQYSSRDLPSHTALKSREKGQGTVDELREKDFRRELEEREKLASRFCYLYILYRYCTLYSLRDIGPPDTRTGIQFPGCLAGYQCCGAGAGDGAVEQQLFAGAGAKVFLAWLRSRVCKFL